MNKKPGNIRLHITDRCNHQCVMCDRWGWSQEDQAHSLLELDTNEYIRLFKEFVSFGIKKITFTGGEPTLRNDFLGLTEQALGQGLAVAIVSNGETLAAMSEKLAAIAGVRGPNFIVAISLLGLDEMHDKHCGSNGSFVRATSALRSLVAHNINAEVFFTVLPGNVHQLEEACDIIRKLGISRIRFGLLHGYGELAFGDREMSILQEQFALLKKIQAKKDPQFRPSYQWYITKMVAEGTMLAKDFQDHLLARLLLESPQDCPCVNGVLFMNPYGDIYPCHYAEFSNQDYTKYQDQRREYAMGNVRQQTLQQIWDGPAYTTFRRRVLPIQPNDLGMKSVCSQCVYLCQNSQTKQPKKKT